MFVQLKNVINTSCKNKYDKKQIFIIPVHMGIGIVTLKWLNEYLPTGNIGKDSLKNSWLVFLVGTKYGAL